MHRATLSALASSKPGQWFKLHKVAVGIQSERRAGLLQYPDEPGGCVARRDGFGRRPLRLCAPMFESADGDFELVNPLEPFDALELGDARLENGDAARGLRLGAPDSLVHGVRKTASTATLTGVSPWMSEESISRPFPQITPRESRRFAITPSS